MFRTIRNNWKKSVFAFCALSYGANWSYDRYQANQIRQFYCQQASIMGSQTLSPMTHANRVAVLLNGQANNGKAKSIYDKTIFPLLHLIGLDVRVYRIDTVTDPNGLNELLTTKIEPEKLSALMIVGGDGTLSELTPHLLQSSVLQNLPICIIPIGEHLSFARSLFPTTNKKKLHDDITLLCESVLGLFNGKVVRKPLLKITMSNTSEKPTYAATFELGHYTRLEQLQKRLWYFSYLKYPVSSIYLYIANSVKSILSSEQPSLVYSNPCSGCLRCQPSLMDQYRLSQEKPKSTFFSRIYRSNRTNPKPVVPELTEPVENPNCGIEYCMNLDKEPVQLWAKLTNDDRSFEIDLSNRFERFNYDKVKYPKESFNVQHIRFYPNPNIISLHMLINHEKLDKKKGNEETDLGECRIELSEKTLKFIEINNDLLLTKKSTLKPIFNKLEEDALEKKTIFLFNRRQQHKQST